MIHDFIEDTNFEEDIRFGEFIRKKRRLLGLNQSDFGKLLGIHQATVSMWELGATSPPFDEAVGIINKLGGVAKIENIKDISSEDMKPFCPFGWNPWQE